MHRVLARDFEHKLKSLQEAAALHGGDLIINSDGIKLSNGGTPGVNSFEVARILAYSVQKYYDEGRI